MKRFSVTLGAAIVGGILVAPLLALIFPLWVFVHLVNRFHEFLVRGAAEWSGMTRFEEGIGWRPKPNFSGTYFDRIHERCSVTTDSEGWPGGHTLEESDVVVYGDSFAFGYGAKADRAYYANVDGCKVKPIAAPGYSMVQELMLMEQHSGRLRGKVVAWFIFLGNDLRDNLLPYMPLRGYTMPFLQMPHGAREWQIASAHVRSERWLFGDENADEKVSVGDLCVRSAYTERVFSATKYLIKSAKQICEGAGARLVLVVIPPKQLLSPSSRRKLRSNVRNRDGFDPEFPEKELHRILNEVGVDSVFGSEFLRAADYKLRDGHWNERGHKKVGAALGRSYQESVRCVEHDYVIGQRDFQAGKASAT